MPAMMPSYRFVVRGRVQGVGFRQAAAQQARQMMLDGWIMNRADGAVEGAVHHVDPAVLAAFGHWLRHGPPTARVDAVEWIEAAAAIPAAAGFTIRR